MVLLTKKHSYRCRSITLSLLLVIFIIFIGCTQEREKNKLLKDASFNSFNETVVINNQTISNKLFNNDNIKYPYIANPQRRYHILSRYKQVKIGMSETDVVNILGKPDEIRPLYAPQIKNAQLVGTTYWYILVRSEKQGSRYKQESLVRISFNKQAQVTKISTWGIEETLSSSKIK